MMQSWLTFPRPSAVNTCCSETLYAFMLAVLTVTSYRLMKPPKLTTSATPGISFRLRATTQSCVLRRSVGVSPFPWMRYR